MFFMLSLLKKKKYIYIYLFLFSPPPAAATAAAVAATIGPASLCMCMNALLFQACGVQYLPKYLLCDSLSAECIASL